MTQNEIIDMAKQAGIEEAYSLEQNQYLVRYKDGSLEIFAKLVAEAEREACKNICVANGALGLAAVIRARGQA